MNRLLWITGGGAALCFAVLVVLSLGYLRADGMGVFDDHIAGYAETETRAYLAALTPEQTALYLGPFRVLDTLFPILLAITLMGVIWTQATGLSRPMRTLATVTPLVYLILDLTENALVAHLLRTGAQVSLGAILQASTYTTGKWIAVTLAMLMAVWAWRLAPKENAA